MTQEERERVIEYVQRKMCKPCRDAGVGSHAGCAEAFEIVELLRRGCGLD